MSDDLGFEKDDEMRFDDDNDMNFEDDFDFDFDPMAEPPRPKGRSPIAHSLIKTSRNFRDSFRDEKLDIAKKSMVASIPSSISNEASLITDIINGVTGDLSKVKEELKKEAKPFINALDSTIPRGGAIERIVNLAKNKLGMDEDRPTAEQLAEDSASKAALAVSEILGEQQDREIQANILRDNIKSKRDLASIELQAVTASNLEFINKFNQDIVSKYHRKSLELQYRHLYTADEQLAVTKTAFDGFKNQLESIVINSALPDLVKTHNSEFVKQKLFNKVTDGLFNSSTVVNSIKSKFRKEITGIGNVLSGGLSAATGALETRNTLADMTEMAGGKEAIAADFLKDGLIGYTGKKISNVLSKTKVGKGAIGYVQDMMIDPSQKLKQQAENTQNGFVKNLLNTASAFTARDSGEQKYSIGKIDRNEATLFDGKTQTSITKIIPGLLSKILAEVKTFRTGKQEDELRFDYDKGTFDTVSNMKNSIDSTITNSLKNSGVTRGIETLLSDLKDKADLKLSNKDLLKVKEGLLGYILTGKPLSPVTLKDNGFYRYFSKDVSKKLEESIDNYIKDGVNKVRLNKDLEYIRSSAPDPMELIGKYNDAGSMDVLKEKGLMKYNDQTGTYTLNNKQYKKILRNSLKDIRESDKVEEEKKNESVIVNAFAKMAEDKKKAVQDNFKSKDTGKKKFTERVSDGIVSSIDTTTDYIGTKLFKDAKKKYHSAKEYTTGKKDFSDYKFSQEGTTFSNLSPNNKRTFRSDISNIKDTVKSFKSMDEIRALIKKDIIGSDDGLFEAISKSMKGSGDSKKYFEEFSKTEEYNKLSPSLKTRLKRVSNKVDKRATKLYSKTKDRINDSSSYIAKGAESLVKKFKDSKTFIGLLRYKDKVKQLYSRLETVTTDNERTRIKDDLNNLINDMLNVLDLSNENYKEVKDLLLEASKIARSATVTTGSTDEYNLKMFEAIGILCSIVGFKRKDLSTTDNNKSVLSRKIKSSLEKLGLPGFKKGGHTGEGDKNEIAGLVHKDEEVVEQGRLDKIFKTIGIKNLKRDEIVNTSINILDNTKKSLKSVGMDIKDFAETNKTPEQMSKAILVNLKDKNKNITKDNIKKVYDETKDKAQEKFTLGSQNVSDALTNFENKFLPNDTRESAFNLMNKVTSGKDKATKLLSIKLYADKLHSMLDKIEAYAQANPDKVSDLKGKVESLRNKLTNLVKEDTETSNTSDLGNKIKEINEEIFSMVERITPSSNSLNKKDKENEIKEKTEGSDEETFLDILNSDDPIGTLKYRIKQGIKKKIKGFITKGAKKLYSVGKKIVLADLERGKKLRGYLKDKFNKWRESEDKPGMVRKAGNKVLNGIGKLSKGALKLGKEGITADVNLGKKLQDKIFSTVKNAVSTKDKEKKNIFDKDGDGLRDGSWLSRLTKRKKDKESKKDEPKTVLSKVKDATKSPMGIATILTGAFLGLKAMGVTLEDISGFTKGAWNVLKGIGKVLGGVWDTLKTVGGWIKDAFGFIKKGLSKIPIVGNMFKDEHGGIREDEAQEAKEKLSKLQASGITSGKEYEELSKKVKTYESAKVSDESSSGAETAGNTVAALGAAYVAKKVAKPVVATYKVGKALTTGTVTAVKGTTNIASKIAGKTDIPVKGKVGGSKIMDILKSFKDLILKKMGPIGGKKVLGTLAAKIAARAVPFAGLALLTYDAGKIAYDMASNGTSLKSAISKQILGFDLFSDDELPTDENGNPIKPDEKEEDFYIKDQLAQEEKDYKKIDGETNTSKITSNFKKEPDKRSLREYERGINSLGNGFSYDLEKNKRHLTEEQYNKLVKIKTDRENKIKVKDTKVVTKPEESKKKSELNSVAEFDALDNEYDREEYLSDLALYKPVSEWTRSDFELLIREVAIGPSEIVEYYYHNPEYLIKDVPPNENGYIGPRMLIKKYENIFGLRPRSSSEEQELRRRITAVIKNALDLKKSGKLKKIKEETNKKIDAQITKDEKKEQKEAAKEEKSYWKKGTSYAEDSSSSFKNSWLGKKLGLSDNNNSNTEYIKDNTGNIVKNGQSNNDGNTGQSFFEKLFSSVIVKNITQKATMGANAIKAAANKGWEAAKNFVSKGIGSVAAYFESGKRGPGTISSGRGDRGGASYGTHQLASKTGTLQKYLAGSKYGEEFNGLVPGTDAFNAKWKEIAKRDSEGFAQDQEAFISNTHYEPQVKKLAGKGLDVNNRTDALKSAVYSVGVQFGPGSSLIPKALAASNVDPSKATDAEIVKAIYSYKQNNNDRLFKSSSSDVRKGTLNRAYKEESMVMGLLSKENSGKPVNNVEFKKDTGIDKIASNVVDKITNTTNTVPPVVNVKPTVSVPTTPINNVTTTNTDIPDIKDATKVAGPAMMETVTKNETSSAQTVTSKPVISNVVAEMKETNATSMINSVNTGLQTTNIDILNDTNKGIHKIGKTLDESLKVQKQMLEALNKFNATTGKINDRELKLSNQDKKEAPTVETKKNSSWDNIRQEEATKPNINLGRKKFA